MVNGREFKGDWVYWDKWGHLITPIPPFKFRVDEIYIVPETVGQWVSEDKNGNDVFEYDRVVWTYYNQVQEGMVQYNQAEKCYYIAFYDKYGIEDGAVYVRRNEIELINSKWEIEVTGCKLK